METIAFFLPPLELWQKLATLSLLAKNVLDNEMIKPEEINEAKVILDDPFVKEWLVWAVKNKPFDTKKLNREKTKWLG